MRLAGITRTYIILRSGKWDIPAYLGDGTMLDMKLAYLIMHLPYGQPYTLDQAYPFVQNSTVALGFPDIIFQADDAYGQLLARQDRTGADVVLGLFRANRPANSDMVEISSDGRVHSIVVKPATTDLTHTWILAVWMPTYTRFMHEYLADLESKRITDASTDGTSVTGELFVGDVMQAAIKNDLHVEGVVFRNGSYLDIGTPEDLVNAIQSYK
jgi:glucose-1-phosphate thymidylyltransferase